MKVRTALALCWEHGHVKHLVDGTEDNIHNHGMCTRCLVVIIRDHVLRRAFVQHHYKAIA